MDGLDTDSVAETMAAERPDIVIHQLTALSGSMNLKRFDESSASTNLLRTVGADLFVGSAHRTGLTRFVAQSYTGRPTERTDDSVKDDKDPINPNPTRQSITTIAAIRHL